MYHVNEILDVSTHEGISLAFRLKSLPSPGETGRRDLPHKEFTRSVLRDKLQGFAPKIQTGLNPWD